ncbi:MAG TPA: GDSL-type esterase/lipase family protein [Acidimicrobiales bacterium]|nr:GDSL-type esterase/lipase family protein [Acidimicrobiales bacterium]
MRRHWLIVSILVLAAFVLPSCGDDGPRRVLLVGDSVMNQTGAALTNVLRDDDIRNEGVNGSGLLTPDYLDWPEQLRGLLERYDPDVVVFLFVGNFDLGTGEVFTTPDGHQITDRSDPRFFRSWQAQAQLMTERAAEDAEVAWVLPPPMEDREGQAVVDGLREAYEEVADETGAELIDANDVLATESGGYLAESENGTPLRNSDGVHLANEGAKRLARLIADEIG